MKARGRPSSGRAHRFPYAAYFYVLGVLLVTGGWLASFTTVGQVLLLAGLCFLVLGLAISGNRRSVIAGLVALVLAVGGISLVLAAVAWALG